MTNCVALDHPVVCLSTCDLRTGSQDIAMYNLGRSRLADLSYSSGLVLKHAKLSHTSQYDRRYNNDGTLRVTYNPF